MKLIDLVLFFILTIFITNTTTAQLNDSIPGHETFTIQSGQLGEDRVINVWTPAGYSTNSVPLPVMYMADGGIKEDFPHIANTLKKLIAEAKIKPLILVGIENTERRRDLTGFTEVQKDKEIAPVIGGSEKFRAFIREELFPEINKKYRTTNEKSIIGESLAGLFVLETFFLEPEMFDNYIAFDPSLWWNDQYWVKTAKEHLSTFRETGKRVWFAGSGAKDIFKATKKLAEIFKAENVPGLTWYYSPEPKEKHHTIFRATKEKAIIWTLNPEK